MRDNIEVNWYFHTQDSATPVSTFKPAICAGFPISPEGVPVGAVLTPDGIDQLLTTAEASTLFGVTAATIRKWAQLGKVDAVGLDRGGRKLYRLIDIARYEKQTRIRSGRENREKRLGLRIPA